MPSQTIEYFGGERGLLTVEETLAVARRVTFGLPVGFFVGMAVRESGLKANEIDTDYDEEGNPRPNKTYGLLQLTQVEAATALSVASVDPERMVDPETNLSVGAATFARYRNALAMFSAPSEEDRWRYIAWAHNNGIGAPLKSCGRYGLDWSALVARPQNDYVRNRLIPYTDTVIEYARQYPDYGGGSDDSFFKLAFALLLAGGLWWMYKHDQLKVT